MAAVWNHKPNAGSFEVPESWSFSGEQGRLRDGRFSSWSVVRTGVVMAQGDSHTPPLRRAELRDKVSHAAPKGTHPNALALPIAIRCIHHPISSGGSAMCRAWQGRRGEVAPFQSTWARW